MDRGVETQQNRPRARRAVIFALVALPVLAALLYLAFRKVETRELLSIMSQANWIIVAAAMGVGVLSHLIRARRWQLLLNTLERPTSLFTAFYAVMVGYFFNLLLPRVGEAVRCVVVSRRTHVKLEKPLGTVVTERLADVFVTLLLTIVTVLFSLSTFGAFLWDEILAPFWDRASGRHFFTLAIVLIACAAAVWGICGLVRSRVLGPRLRVRIRRFFRGLAQGMNSLRRMKGKWEFMGWTVALWGAYWLMTYLICLALPATSGLSLSVSLTLLVVGTFGMFVPVQGGIGSFHLIVMLWLMALGQSRAEGLAYATLSHGCQTALLIAVPAALEVYRQIVKLRRQPAAQGKGANGESKK